MDNQLNSLLQNAIELFSNNQLAQAEEICNKVLKINKFFPDAYHILSVISNAKGDTSKAIAYINQAININPNNHLYYTNLGEFYKRVGNNYQAEISLKKAVQLNSQFSGSRYNLANVLKAQGKIEEALQYYNEAIRINPSDWQSYQNMGNSFMELNKYFEAAACYWNAIRIKPELFEAEVSLANCFYEMKNYYKSEFHCKNVLNVKPDNDVCLKALGVIFELQSRIEEAYEVYKRYADKDKNDFTRQLHLESLEPFVYMTNNEIEYNRKKLFKLIDKYINEDIQQLPDNAINENIHPNIQLGYQGRDNKELKEKYAYIFRNIFKKENLNTDKNNKIKIGYFVSSSHEGIFSKFFHKIINNLSDEFEQFIICTNSGWNTHILKEIKSKNVKFVDIPDKFDQMIPIIKNLNLNILYHWEIGTDTTNYFLPFLKLAPVQCTSIGWPDTSGIPEVDYFISSELIETENAQQQYSEKLVKFKNLPLLCNKPELPAVIKPITEFGLSSDNKIYLCCQNLRKIHPDFDILINDILSKDKDGLVVFVGHQQKQINDLLKSRLKITVSQFYDRIKFIPTLNYDDYLSVLSQADVVLDTLYFGGANTSYEAFAVNTPIATLPWSHERGKYTEGCYKLMNISECIAYNFDEYSDIAVRIANDSSFRKIITDKIRQNNHLLFDNNELIEEYNQFFRKVAKN